MYNFLTTIGIPICSSTQFLYNIIPEYDSFRKEGTITNIIPESDFYYVVGTIPVNIANFNILPYIAKFNYEGKLLNFKKVDDSIEYTELDLRKYPITKKENRNYYMRAGVLVDPTDYRISPYIIELNPENGKIQKGKYFKHPIDLSPEEYYSTTFLYNNNKIYLSFFYRTNNKPNLELLELDTSLELKGKIEIPYFGYWLYPRLLNQLDNGQFEMTGESVLLDSNYNPIKNISPFYLRIDTNGQILKFKQLITSQYLSYFLSDVFTIERDDNKNWILGLTQYLENKSCASCWRTIPYILSISPEFDTLNWITRFSQQPIEEDFISEFFSLTSAYDKSGFLGVSTTLPHYPDSLLPVSYIFKVSSKGDSLWTRKVSPLGIDTGRLRLTELLDIKATRFNTYLIGGLFYDSLGWVTKPWILQVDSLGCLIPGCQHTVTSKDIKSGKEKPFLLYPNPILNDKIYLLSRTSIHERCELIIYDLSGYTLKNIKFIPEEGVQYIIDLSEKIPNGQYFIEIKGKNIIQTESFELLRD